MSSLHSPFPSIRVTGTDPRPAWKAV